MRQKRESRPRVVLTDGQREYLRTGETRGGEVFLWSTCDEDLVRRAWIEWRDEITEEFVREHPGQRPWAEGKFGC